MCRVCVVEVEGSRTLQTACSQPVSDGWWFTPIQPGYGRPAGSMWSSCSQPPPGLPELYPESAL